VRLLEFWSHVLESVVESSSSVLLLSTIFGSDSS
jgi:hypothetical protein